MPHTEGRDCRCGVAQDLGPLLAHLSESTPREGVPSTHGAGEAPSQRDLHERQVAATEHVQEIR